MFPSLSLGDPFTLFLAALATLGVVGYLVGRAVNKRRTQAISAWLEPGMRGLGGTPAVQAVNRTAFRVKVVQARPPFSVVTATTVLISREAFPTWLWEATNRRRDVLIFHLTLRRPPTVEADWLDPTAELGQRGASQVRALDWTDGGVQGAYHLFHAPTTDPTQLAALAALVAESRYRPYRVAVRRHAPHLLISMALPDIRSETSADLIRWLSRLVKATPLERGNGRE